MIRRIRRTLPWFGAVAALLLLALPVQADEMEPDPYADEEVESDPYADEEVDPDPYAEEEPEPEVAEEAEPEAAAEPDRYLEKFADIAVIRPLHFARLVVGIPFFIFYPFTIASGYDEDVVELLWTEPYEATFSRPLGEVPSDY